MSDPNDNQAAIDRTTGYVHDALRRLADDPSVPAELLERVRFACQQAWNAGWYSRAADHRTGQLTPNPFEGGAPS